MEKLHIFHFEINIAIVFRVLIFFCGIGILLEGNYSRNRTEATEKITDKNVSLQFYFHSPGKHGENCFGKRKKERSSGILAIHVSICLTAYGHKINQKIQSSGGSQP